MIRALLESVRQLDLFEQPPLATPSHWPVRVSRRAKYLRINIQPNGDVEVVVPPRCKPKHIENFVAENRAWVDRQLAKIGPIEHGLPQQIDLPALDQTFRVLYQTDGQPRWQCEQATLVVGGAKTEHPAVLQDWLKQWARQELTPRVERYAEQTDLPFERLQWRLQKTRWGSCSSNRTISLNAAILLLQPTLADYVILHELCHLKYMSHGPRFWSLLTRHCNADAKALDRELNEFALGTRAWLYR